jgi:hypothetical protein
MSLSIPLGLALVAGCGAVKDTATQIKNGFDIQGHWLMTKSEHSNAVANAVENQSMVLTFKDGKAAFSPTDSIQGRAVFALLSHCTAGPRPYHMDKDQLVLEPITGCGQESVTIDTLDNNTLKFPDPDDTDTTRTFQRIDESKYDSLVKTSDRQP